MPVQREGQEKAKRRLREGQENTMKRSIIPEISIILILSMNFFGGLVCAGESQSDLINMLSLQEGVIPVATPGHYGSWIAANLLDGSASSGWACESGKINDNAFVFEMVGITTFEVFEFDNSSVDEVNGSAKDIVVEVSTTSQGSGFTPVLTTTLANTTDNQRFPAETKIPARWVRLTIRNNYGSTDYTELFSFRGFGKKPETPAPATISGTYESTYSNFHVRQQGTALTGCYEFNEGLLEGTIEGRVMKITWQESGDPDNKGPAIMVFSEDGKSFQGYWWRKGYTEGTPNGDWVGKKIASEVGGCPHWSGSVGGELKKQLSGEKRARLYGILFDFNAAVIRPESKPVLDEVVDLMKSEPEWNLTIEGHTDAIGADERNMTLSQQRADSVKTYLVEKGIDAARLKTAGFGESKPVADNDSELGRAQNRRVELVRE